MDRRRLVSLSLAALTASRTTLAAAQALRPRAVGWLVVQHQRVSAAWLAAIREALAQHGQVEGRGYVLEQRHADGDASQLARLAEELVAKDVAVIVASGQSAVDASRKVTQTVPIVGRMIDDPVQAGYARSLARPSLNVTGVYSQLDEMSAKRLELMRQVVPGLKKAGALLNRGRGATTRWLAEVEKAAAQLGVELVVMDVASADDLERVFALGVQAGIGGVLTFRNPVIVTHARAVIALADRHRLPIIYDAREFVEAGALMSYGPSLDAIYRRAGYYVDRILRGTPPGDLPIEQPTKFELVINLRAAKAMGLALPPALLAIADDMIE